MSWAAASPTWPCTTPASRPTTSSASPAPAPAIGPSPASPSPTPRSAASASPSTKPAHKASTCGRPVVVEDEGVADVGVALLGELQVGIGCHGQVDALAACLLEHADAEGVEALVFADVAAG